LLTQELEPFKSFSQLINVWTLWAPSAEVGTSYDCACTHWDSPAQNCLSPMDGCKDGFRNVMFGSIFTVRALFGLMPLSPPPDLATDRNLFPMYLFRIAMAQSLTAADGTPVSGEAAFMLTNSPKEGAFGLYNASLSTAYALEGVGNLAEVATHEMGHAFGVLGDEYTTSTDICQVFELTALFPNFSLIPEVAQDIPWEPWVTLNGPYPNTEDQGTAGDVGCFIPGPGGGKCCMDGDCGKGYLSCRPMKTCKMKSSSAKFCPVCTEHLIKRIFEHVDVILSEKFAVTKQEGAKLELTVDVSLTDVATTWRLDGVEVQSTAAYAPYVLDLAGLAPGDHTLKLAVRAGGDKVKVWTDSVTESMEVTVTVP
jgi:hypothetical protein